MATETTLSPYQLYNNWLFNPDMKIEVPKELLKYNSPISVFYVLNMFIMNAKLNSFLNEHLNNIGVHYLEKEELFKFLKKCVKDFKVQKNSIPFIPRQKNEKLYEALRKKIAVLKNYELTLLSDIINKSEEKDGIYNALGLVKTEKPKKVKKTKPKKEKGLLIKDYLKKNFQMAKV